VDEVRSCYRCDAQVDAMHLKKEIGFEEKQGFCFQVKRGDCACGGGHLGAHVATVDNDSACVRWRDENDNEQRPRNAKGKSALK
jgi:hypothetical protein